MNLTRFSQFRHTILVGFTVLSLLLLGACASQPQQVAEAPETVLMPEETPEQSQFQKAIALLKEDKTDQAKLIFENLNKQHPDYIGPLSNLGLIALKQENLEHAKFYFRQVFKLKNTNITALNSLGVIARKEGKFDEAEAYYRQVLALDENNQIALRNLGILLDLYRGHLSEALALYERYQGLQAKPDAQMKDWIYDIKSRIKAEAKK